MEHNPPFECILFDKDGVIIDFEKTWTPVVKAVAAELADGDAALEGVLLEQAGYDAKLARFTSGSIWAAGHSQDLVECWLPLTELTEPSALLGVLEAHSLNSTPVGVLPPAQIRQILSVLKNAGFKIGMATNDSELSAKQHVQKLELAAFFDMILGCDSVVNPKPAPDPIMRFCAFTNTVPAQLIMVGDNPHDLEMARAARAGLAVAVLSGNSTEQEISGLADKVISSIAALPDFINSYD